MAVNLPPQAYTREVMGQAYEWLQTQPLKVREMATSMDAVVGLFLQHRRRGDSAPLSTSPISSQKFKENLQNLAAGMKEFEGPAETTAKPAAAPTSTPQGQLELPPLSPKDAILEELRRQEKAANKAPAAAAPSAAVPSPAAVSPRPTQPMPPIASSAQLSAKPSAQLGAPGIELNVRTLESLEKVRQALNLSSHEEALRMLVELGLERVKEILPKS